MKIAVFTKRTTFHDGFGGLETQNQALCEGLVKRGYEVTVFSPRWNLIKESAQEKGVKYVFVECVYRMGPVFGFFGTLQKNNWINRSYEEFKRIHDDDKYDLVLAHSSTGLGIIRHKRELDVSVISISHGTIVGEYKTFLSSAKYPRDTIKLIKNTGFTLKNFFRRQRDFVHGSDKIISVSNFMKKALIDETFVDDTKVEVIFNGTDPSVFFPPDTVLTRGSKLLYVGQIVEPKGIKDIIKMMEDTKFKNFSIDFAGSGDLLAEMQQKFKDDVRINFLGKLKMLDIYEKVYKNQEYGVFVFPTKRAEGLPMVLIECLFAGIPTVVYNNGGVGDAVFDGETGFLVPPGNFELFMDKTLELLNSEEMRNSFANQSLKKAHNSFTLEIMLNKYEKVFQEVLNK